MDVGLTTLQIFSSGRAQIGLQNMSIEVEIDLVVLENTLRVGPGVYFVFVKKQLMVM